MTDNYPVHRRVFIVDTIADTSAPTAEEIQDGVDISNVLNPDGLVIPANTESVARTRWTSRVKTSRPIRHDFDGASITAERAVAAALWELAVFGDEYHLVVLTGFFTDDSWLDSAFVQIYRFQFGQRALDTIYEGVPITFTVPIFISSLTEAAVVGMFSSGTIDDEDGDALLDESGAPLIEESV